MKVFKTILIWLFMIGYLAMATGFVTNKHDGLICNKINVVIKDSTDAWFLSSRDIVKILSRKGVKYLGVPVSQINLIDVENAVISNQIVKTCKAYTGVDGSLNVEVIQREPLLRIFDANGYGYYIDKEGNIATLSIRFSPHVLVFSGNIQTPFKLGTSVNIKNLGNSHDEQKLKDIFTLAKFISSEKLWNSQIVQVYLNHSDEFELIPRVGPHLILLGDINDYVEKFEKLEIFYKEGLNNTGWNQYSKINLKFKDQIVCTKI